MAEETTDTPNQDDFSKVQEFIKGEVRTYLEEEMGVRRSQQQQQQSPAVPADPHKELREYIQPAIQPEFQSIRIENADTRDMLTVMNDPVYREYSSEVEAIFTTLKEQGRPIPRKDILHHVMGKEFTTNPEKFNERTGKVKKAQLERANYAVDVGGNTVGRSGSSPAFPDMDEFRKMPSSEQAKYLEGVTL